jgi:hypothetical protein
LPRIRQPGFIGAAQVRDGVRGSGVIFEKYAVFRVFIHFPHIAAARMAFA